MYSLAGQVQNYAWGSVSVLPEFLGRPGDGRPWAELWLGSHPAAPATVLDAGLIGTSLAETIAKRPKHVLGEMVLARFGPQLPFLLKLIAPSQPLSLQVHPGLERAREQYAAEEAAGIPVDAPSRNYKDPNHKPELLYALRDFEAVCGFRTPRRAAEILEGLGTALTDRLAAHLLANPDAHGMRAAFNSLITPHLAPSADAVGEVAAACAARRADGTGPSPRTDAIVTRLQEHHPGDPGVVAALLLNPVTLRPGEAIYVPPGDVHAYLSGLGVEIMAASDNVLRAGLTVKQVDPDEMLACVSCAAAPPMRIAGERVTPWTEVFYAPVDDFELSVTTLDGDPFRADVLVPGTGPRILLGLDGDVIAATAYGQRRLRVGDAVFVAADEGRLLVGGHGRVAQATVP